MAFRSVAHFLETLRELHLVDPRQEPALAGSGARDPLSLARELVKLGVLTPFQINELFRERGKQLLLGSYVLLEKLGEGGMGAVFKARNWKLGSVVALKLIRKERLKSTAALRRFQREIRASAKLDHPHIVRALDADEVGGVQVLVMEYVADAMDLHRLVKEKGPLPVDDACLFLRQAALGLQHAFENQVTHRDIKPHNLLVGFEESRVKEPASGSGSAVKLGSRGKAAVADERVLTPVVKILDFGLARLDEDDDSSTLTQEGAVMGTLDYLAPEQARDSHQADIRADLYSLGCTFFYVLTGRPPFAGGSAAEKMFKHQFEEPAALESVRPDVPAALSDVVLKLLAKHPADRYQTPAALALDLDAVFTGRPVAAKRPRTAVPAAPGQPAPPQPTIASGDNPFAALSQSETSSESPVTLKMTPKAPAPEQNRTVITVSAAVGIGLMSLILLIAWGVNRRDKPAVVDPNPPVPKKTAATIPAEEEAKLPQPKPRKTDDDVTLKKRLAKEKQAEQKRAKEADQALVPLAAQLRAKDAGFALIKEVHAFQAAHGGTPASALAAELLTQLPSPLDRLDPATIPADAKVQWQVQGLDARDIVAVLGDHRRRHWGAGRLFTLSADGKVAAGVGVDNVIRLWRANDLTEIGAIRVEQRAVFALALSPDGSKLLEGGTGDGGTPQLWDVATGKLIRRFGTTLTQAILCADFSADGTLALTGRNSADQGTLQLWDVATGTETARLTDDKSSDTTAVKFIPGRTWAASSNLDKKVRIWDLSAKSVRQRLEHTHPVVGVAVSADGRRLASMAPGDAKGGLRIWDVATGELQTSVVSNVRTALFTADGQRLVAGGNSDGSLGVFDLAGGARLAFGGESQHGAIGNGLLPDGRRLLSGTDQGTVRMWDIQTGTELLPLEGPAGPVAHVAFSLDHEALLAGDRDNRLRQWDVLSRTVRREMRGSFGRYLPTGEVFSVDALSGAARVLDREGQVLHELGDVATYDVAPDGTRVLINARAGRGVSLHDVPGRKEIRQFIDASPQVTALALAPDGRRAASSEPGRLVRVWDVSTGEELRRYDNLETDVAQLCWAPDGPRLAAVLANGAILLLDTIEPTATPVALRGYASRTAAFGPDGRHLLSADTAGRVVLWNTLDQRKLKEWHFPGPIGDLAFAADGRHFATANSNGTVYILRLPAELLRDESDRRLVEWVVSQGGTAGWFDGVEGKMHQRARKREEIASLPMHNLTFSFAPFRLAPDQVLRLLKFRTLDGLHVSDAFLPPTTWQAIGAVATLRSLGAARTNLDDAALVHVGKLPRLAWLDADRTDVSDAGLEHLTGLRRLGTLNVRQTRVTAVGVKKLAAALPWTKIVSDHGAVKPSAAPEPSFALEQEREAERLEAPAQVVNSLGMRLNLVPAGRFLMGSPATEKGRQGNEGPQHEVVISKSFFVGIHEVTQAHYTKIMGQDAARTPGGGTGHPVAGITWNDAVEFCRKLSELPTEKEAGRVYRLPTEAEWEHACRAGTHTRYFFGDDEAQLHLHAAVDGRLSAVGKLRPNAWGLHDVHGNVWEWVADYYAAGAYKGATVIDPQGPALGAERGLRGGSHTAGDATQGFCRSAARHPQGMAPDKTHPTVGFRIVCDVSQR